MQAKVLWRKSWICGGSWLPRIEDLTNLARTMVNSGEHRRKWTLEPCWNSFQQINMVFGFYINLSFLSSVILFVLGCDNYIYSF